MPPITAFVAAGFEHGVANMYFLPFGLFVKSDAAFIAAAQPVTGLSHLTWTGFLAHNLVPVTIGNILGGALMVGAVYWFVYLRSTARPATPADSAARATAAATDGATERSNTLGIT